jgi:hypothetical protein
MEREGEMERERWRERGIERGRERGREGENGQMKKSLSPLPARWSIVPLVLPYSNWLSYYIFENIASAILKRISSQTFEVDF